MQEFHGDDLHASREEQKGKPNPVRLGIRAWFIVLYEPPADLQQAQLILPTKRR